MTNKKLFLTASVCGVALLVTGCSNDPMGMHRNCGYGTYEHHQPTQHKHKKYQHEHKNRDAKPTVFYQKYTSDDIHNVRANMITKSVNGGTTEMGFINFIETDDGLKMDVDLVYLRPGVGYTVLVYQCGVCNDSTCCDMFPMNIDLPQIKNNQDNRLQESYIIRGLTATQLNNAKLILTRDGGYKAAWGMLKQ